MEEIGQKTWEKINLVVCKINNIQDTYEFRSVFLKELRELVYFDLADFCLSNADTKAVSLIDPVVVSRYSKQFEENFTFKYEREFEQIDYTKWIFSNSESIVFRESDMIKEELRKKSAYYMEYLKPLNLIHVAGISIASNGIRFGAANLYRNEQTGDFSKRDIYILEQFLPHLKQRFLNKTTDLEEKKDKFDATYKVLSGRYDLSKREIDVVKLVCIGKSNLEISEALFITPNTVKKHMTKILLKFKVANRVQLLNLLFEQEKALFWENPTQTKILPR